MAINRSSWDSRERFESLFGVTLKVVTDAILYSPDKVRVWVDGAKAKLEKQDAVITEAIKLSGDRPGNYNLKSHEDRVRCCALTLAKIEEKVGGSKGVSIGFAVRMASVDVELRLMEATSNDLG